MKKILMFTIFAILSLTFSMVAVLATAPAVVNKNVSCRLLDSDGNVVFASTSHQVFSMDKNGNSKLTCRIDLPSGNNKKAIHWNFGNTGLICSTGMGFTSDWKAVITPSGQAMLTCHINPSS